MSDVKVRERSIRAEENQNVALKNQSRINQDESGSRGTRETLGVESLWVYKYNFKNVTT